MRITIMQMQDVEFVLVKLMMCSIVLVRQNTPLHDTRYENTLLEDATVTHIYEELN
jgi:hypothetical protein